MTNHPTLRSGAAALSVLALAGAAATPAAAKTTTLRLFAHTVASHGFSQSHKSLPNNAVPKVGDYLVTTEKVYAGTSVSHAKKAEGSIQMTCTLEKFVSLQKIDASCTTVLSIGSSSLTLRPKYNVAALPKTSTYPIAQGTGVYKGATGRWTSTSLSATNANITITANT